MTRVLAKVSILALAFSSLFVIAPTHAANITIRSDVMETQDAGAISDHTITFTTASAVEGASSDTITVTFPAGFDISNLTEDDVDITDDAAELTTAADCLGTEDMGVAVAGQVITFTACTGDITDIASGSVVVIELGEVATASGTGASANAPVNHSTGNTSYTITVAGTFGDTGGIDIPILDDDFVTVTATVAETITFDIDVATTTPVATGSTAAYTVALGNLTTADVKSSGDTDSVNIIGLELDSNASGGTVVQVKNANGASGLVSTSVSGDDIDQTVATLSAGTEGYGICISRVKTTTGRLTGATFTGGITALDGTQLDSANCDNDSHVITAAMTTSFQDILNTGSAAVSGGDAEVYVKAAIDNNTAAHDDYTDTITFRATATF